MKLNKTEREALVRKITDKITEEIKKENQQKIDNYIPSNDFLEVSDYFDVLIKVFKELHDLVHLPKSSCFYDSYFSVEFWEKRKKSILTQLEYQELKLKSDYLSPSFRDRINDDLILSGIDPTTDLEQTIQNLINKYKKLI